MIVTAYVGGHLFETMRAIESDYTFEPPLHAVTLEREFLEPAVLGDRIELQTVIDEEGTQRYRIVEQRGLQAAGPVEAGTRIVVRFHIVADELEGTNQ